jgi:tRNA modification GTPase
LILALSDQDRPVALTEVSSPVIRVRTKADLVDSDSKQHSSADIAISVRSGAGLERLIGLIGARLDLARPMPSQLITRTRQRDGVARSLNHLRELAESRGAAVEVKAELLRSAADALGRVTGKVDVEDLLDVIFSEFCIGK